MVQENKSTRIDCSATINEYITQDDWRVKANANAGFSSAGLINNVAGKVIANYWLDNVYPKDAGEAHRNGDIHLHDLDTLTGYCSGWSLRQLLNEGFNCNGTGRAASRAPKHFREALGQMANFIGILQSEWAGAQAFSSFDTYLAPYVFKDKLSDKEIEKAIIQFVYNLNVPSRWGQSPFSNITLDISVPKDLQNQKPTIKYKEHLLKDIDDELLQELKNRDSSITTSEDACFKHFVPEMKRIVIAYYNIMTRGDASGQPFTFPIPTVNITDDFNWDDEVADIIFDNARRVGSSYFQNFVGSQKNPDAYKPDAVRSMCPLTGDTEVLTNSSKGITIQNINTLVKYGTDRDTLYRVWNGYSWVSINNYQKHDKQRVFKITLSNGSVIKLGENHIQPTIEGNILAKELEVGMWLPFNKRAICAGLEELGTKELGFVVGAYLGDGCKDTNGINYSLAKSEKDDVTEERIRKFFTGLGYSVSTTYQDGLRSVRVGSGSYTMIESFIEGTNALTKGLSRKVFNMNKDFRQGLLDGLSASDGSIDKNRIYTSSELLRDDLIKLCATLGQKVLWSSTDTRENRLGTNACYCLSYPLRENYGDFFRSDNNYSYYIIRQIEELPEETCYCLETNEDSHLFMLANGLITHNCRLQLDLRQLQKRGNGLFGSAEKTGSVGVVTLNMARLGYLYKGNKEELISHIDTLLETSKNALEAKRVFITQQYNNGLYPYTKRYLTGFDTYFSTIGVNGMNEMIRNFTNDADNISTESGIAFAKEILDHIRNKLSDFQEDTGNMYNLEATPAEGTTYRFAKEDKKRYEDIIQAGSGKNIYYTNSSQLPANFTDDPFEALDLQDELQIKYTGGTVLHIYVGELLPDIQSTKNFMKKVIESYMMPYVTLSPVFSVCEEHGYLKGEQECCPQCGKHTKVWSRVMGYYRPVESFNIGKQGEHKERKFFKYE